MDGRGIASEKTDVDGFGRILQAVSSAYRRRILRILDTKSPPETVDAVADALSTNGDTTTDEQVIVLDQVHLPNLERAELVEYKRDEKRVTITQTGSETREALETIEERISY